MAGKKPSNRQPAQTVLSVTPQNLKEQEEAFFENDCRVNPIFKYASANISKYVGQFKPSDEHLSTAIGILDSCIAEFGSESAFMETDGGILLTPEETTEHFSNYIKELSLEGKVNLVFSERAIAPTSIVHFKNFSRVTAALPIMYRQKRIRGVFQHEIGTHLVRCYNERKQVWRNKRSIYALKPHLETEEGFASLNTLIDSCVPGRKPYLWRAAMHYYSSYCASHMSFVELFEDLEKYIDDPQKRYKEAVRVKRGLEDTGENGGCYKDQLYLAGAIKVLRSRREIDFMTLICGRLSLEDTFRPEIRKRAVTTGILVPPYLKSIPDYISKLDMLAAVNGIN